MSVTDAIEWAESQVGEHETPLGSNRIHYWDDIGLSYLQGFAWCAVFQYLAIQHGGGDLSWTTPRRFVDTTAAVADAKRAGRFRTGTPRPGDAGWVNLDNDPGPEHGVFVTGVSGPTVYTIEGNVRDRVVTNRRHISTFVGFGEIDYTQEEEDVDLNDRLPLFGYSKDALRAAGWEEPIPDEILVRQALEWAVSSSMATRAAVQELLARPGIDIDALAERLAHETDVNVIREALREVLPEVRLDMTPLAEG
jgi:hypothetical protein